MFHIDIMATIFTIGYGNMPINELAAVLHRHEIEILVDVRSRPYSRSRPEFRKRELASYLIKSEIEYRYMGDSLGGLPEDQNLYADSGKVDYNLLKESEDYKRGIKELRALGNYYKICLMCAESDPGQCHRGTLIAESLREQGMDVLHILRDGGLEGQESLRKKFGDNQAGLL